MLTRAYALGMAYLVWMRRRHPLEGVALAYIAVALAIWTLIPPTAQGGVDATPSALALRIRAPGPGRDLRGLERAAGLDGPARESGRARDGAVRATLHAGRPVVDLAARQEVAGFASSCPGYIVYWSQVYAQSPAYMCSVSWCENRWQPVGWNWDGSGAYGIFQFKGPTYYWLRQQENADPTHAPGLPDAFDPEWRAWGDPVAQAHLAAWAFYKGYRSWWACA